jgi:undecaprenyl-diphosphatase
VDYRLFNWVNRVQLHTGWAHGIFRFYAKDGIALFAVVLLAGWWVSRSRSDLAGVAGSVWAAGAALIGLAVNQVIGHAVDRARPYVTHPGVHLLVAPTKDASFPSDHAVVAGAVAAGLLLVDRRVGIVAAILAILMAFARVYVGAHYPGDVIAGLAIGGAIAAVAYRPVVAGLSALARWMLRTPLAVLVASDTDRAQAPAAG